MGADVSLNVNYEALRDLVLEASSAGRGRLDSGDWEEADDYQFLQRLDAILRGEPDSDEDVPAPAGWEWGPFGRLWCPGCRRPHKFTTKPCPWCAPPVPDEVDPDDDDDEDDEDA